LGLLNQDPKVPVKFGIYPKMPDDGPITTLLYEWKRIWKDVKQPGISWSDRFNYMFNSPGWRHDGTGKTVRQYQKDYFDKKKRQKAQKEGKLS